MNYRIGFEMNPERIYFISDTHFSHKSIMQYSKRPWQTVEEMDEALIQNWNAVVPQIDAHVFHLGDFGFGHPEDMADILRRLNGNKYLLLGNHDRNVNAKMKDAFIWVKDYYELMVLDNDRKQKIVLCHYPLGSWNVCHYGSWNLHGHCHGNYKYTRGKQLDVGVDALPGYRPHSYNEIKQIMDSKQFMAVDHHVPHVENR